MMLTGHHSCVFPFNFLYVSLAEAFAAKHMPDLGQEVEDFQVQTWRVQNWSASSKRMVGADFFCGGHKWSVQPSCHAVESPKAAPLPATSGRLHGSMLTNPVGPSASGAYSSSLKGTRTGSRTTWSRSTSTTPTQREHQKDGTRVLSLHSQSQTRTTRPSSPSLVSPALFRASSSSSPRRLKLADRW
jgi:hypothetical protein